MEKLLQLLDNIEIELKQIGEWKSTRSEDLDWWLPLSEYLQFITIPEHRELLEKGEFPNHNSSHLDAVHSEWIRNPKWEKTAQALRRYYEQLTAEAMASGAPQTNKYQFESPYLFFKLLSDDDVADGKKMAEEILGQAKELYTQRPEHQDTFNSLISWMDRHLQHLSKNEVPPAIESRTALYFSVVDADPLLVPIEKSILHYQTWLQENPDNKRIHNPWTSGTANIEIEVPVNEVNIMFETVYSELGKLAKISGFKLGEAPIEELRKNKSIRTRAIETTRERLMQVWFDEKVMKPELRLMTFTFRDVLAQFQPLTRLNENEPFRFMASYNESLYQSLQNGT